MDREPSADLLEILYLTPERHPSSRPDVAGLLGKYVPRHQVSVDLVTLAAKRGDVLSWPGGRTLVTRATGRKTLDAARDLAGKVTAMLFRGRRRYGGVLVRDMPTLGGLAWLACRLRGIAFFYWVSFPIVDGYLYLVEMGPRRVGWIRWTYTLARARCGRLVLAHLVLRRADHVFVQSEAMKTALVAEGFEAKRFTAVPMGVDLEDEAFCKATAVANPALEGREVLVYVGSLSSARRLDVMIEAFAIAWRQRPGLLLVIVGQGELQGQEEALREVALREGVADQIVWTGWLPRPEAMQYMRSAIVGLSFIPRGTLYDVSSPTKVCEYLAMGVPALVNDLPDQVLVAQRSGAARVVEMEPQRMADALLALVSDPAALQRMAELGPAFVARERSYGVIGPQVAAKLREVIEASRRRAARAA